jgi:hypothetical protein
MKAIAIVPGKAYSGSTRNVPEPPRPDDIKVVIDFAID